jgi:ABC-type nitrate/sulfonate/bicarbonate transport system substrate-binding protein
MNSWYRRGRALALTAAASLVISACSGAGSPSPTATSGPTGAPSSGEPSSGGPAETVPIKYTFDWKCDGDWAPAIWAEDQGYFDEENLDVEYVAGDGSSAALPLIATNEMQIGQISAPPLILGSVEDLPVTAVGVQMTSSPLVLLADGSIKTVDDFAGKKVAVQEGEFEGAVWNAFAKEIGLEEGEYERVPSAGGADVLFIDKQVDVFMDFYTSGAMVGLTEGREGEESLFLIRDYLPILGHTTVVNNTFLEENPEAVAGFLRAWAKGMKYAIDHPEETVDTILSKCPENERAALEWSVGKYTEFWQNDQAKAGGLLSFTDEGWTATKDVLVSGGLMEDGDISDVYTDQYLPDPPIQP